MQSAQSLLVPKRGHAGMVLHYAKLHRSLLQMGFTIAKSHASLFVLSTTTSIVLALDHVDDIFIATPQQAGATVKSCRRMTRVTSSSPKNTLLSNNEGKVRLSTIDQVFGPFTDPGHCWSFRAPGCLFFLTPQKPLIPSSTHWMQNSL